MFSQIPLGIGQTDGHG